MMDKTFTTWAHAGIAYLAVPSGNAVHITDERGRWYGAWQSVMEFRRHQKSASVISLPLDGIRAECVVRTHEVQQ